MSADQNSERQRQAKREIAKGVFEKNPEGFKSALSNYFAMGFRDLDGSALDWPQACFRESNEDTLVNLCVTHGQAQPLRALLAAGANPKGKAKEGDYEPIHHIGALPEEAAIEFARIFLEAGLSVNCHPPGGVTPLLMAVKRDRAALAAFLLARGADPNLAGPDGLDAPALANAMGSARCLAALGAWRDERELRASLGPGAARRPARHI